MKTVRVFLPLLVLMFATSSVWARPEMALIPAGEFEMGDTYGEGDPSELPVHKVEVDAFYIDKWEVSNIEMCRVLQWALGRNFVEVRYLSNSVADGVFNTEGTSMELVDLNDRDCQIVFSGGAFSPKKGKAHFPSVENGWHGALAYCHFRSDIDGLEPCVDMTAWTCDFSKSGYRLPTEAEWEKAARGGMQGQHYSWSSEGGSYSTHIDGSKANYLKSGDKFESDPVPTTVPVKYFEPNGYGLYNMPGNIHEWCYDFYSPDYYKNSPANNPTGPETGTEKCRRGGCWNSSPDLLRCATRGHKDPLHRGKHVGMRAVRKAIAEPPQKHSISGRININPNNSDRNEFVMILPDGSTITRDMLADNYEGYRGRAVSMHVKPHGNGNQNGLVVDGKPYSLVNANVYDISAEQMTVKLYQDKDKNGNAMGKWWIEITAINADIVVVEPGNQPQPPPEAAPVPDPDAGKDKGKDKAPRKMKTK